jgi:hypothetical protein
MNEERGRNEFEESDVHLIKLKTGWGWPEVLSMASSFMRGEFR